MSDGYRALEGDRFKHSAHGLTLLTSPATEDFRAYGFALHAPRDHSVVHAATGTCKT